jgi:multidrug resistance efflux pump
VNLLAADHLRLSEECEQLSSEIVRRNELQQRQLTLAEEETAIYIAFQQEYQMERALEALKASKARSEQRLAELEAKVAELKASLNKANGRLTVSDKSE